MASLTGKLRKWYRTEGDNVDPPTQTDSFQNSEPSSLPAKKFQYKPPELKKHRSFRVLHLHPSKRRDDILQFSLSVYSLTYPPEYDAISYTWDAQSFDVGAICHGKRFLITKNCQMILTTLRRKKKVRLIWIDQICVNQGDFGDRASNVQNMGTIYKKSKNVFIWPGHVDIETRDFLYRVVGSHRRTVQEYDDDPKYYDIANAGHLHPPVDLGKIGMTEDRLYNKFISSPWFGRMWTFQEYVGVGHDNLFFVIEDNLLWSPRLEQFGVARRVSTLPGLTLLAEFRQTTRPFELSSILEYTLQRQCSEPKDKIFALHGVMGALLKQKDVGDQLSFPSPTYFEDVSDTYYKATKWALDYRRDVGMIYLAAVSSHEFSQKDDFGPPRLYQFPTWVPNLQFISRLQRPSTLALSSLGSPLPYSASLGAPLDLSYSFGTRLELQGNVFGDVDLIGSEFTGFPKETSSNHAESSHSVAFYATLRSWLNEARSYAQTTHDAPGLTFELDPRNLFRGSLSHLQSHFSFDSDEECEAMLHQIEERSNKEFGDSIENRTVEEEALYMGCCAHFANKSLLISNRGPIGIGLGRFEPEDKIVMAAGFGELLILRPHYFNPNFFTFVGYAYMEGLMQGEAWPEDERELIDIHIG